MSTPVLSLCIPTYNRAEYLPALFDSLAAELDGLPDPHQVEICISDNCSTDASRALIEAFARRYPAVRCAWNERNLGFDVNLQLAGSMAQGQWIWFMGSDDLIPKGAMAAALAGVVACSPRTGVVIWNRKRIDVNGAPMSDEDWFPTLPDGAEIDVANGGLTRYCDSADTLGCLFSYIGVLMIRRDRWEALDFSDTRHIGSGYIHVARTLSVLLAGTNLTVRRTGIAVCRMNNDDLFRSEGLYRRRLLDFNGFHQIGLDLIADPVLLRAWWSVLWREHPSLFAILRRCTRAQAREITAVWRQLGVPEWKVRLLMVASHPLCRPFSKPIVKGLRKLGKLRRKRP
jgi:abequosyltransferase